METILYSLKLYQNEDLGKIRVTFQQQNKH